MSFLLEIIRLGLANILRHKLRSVLTALGIILGVAAVITMVSIGEGGKRRALDQIERLGARNIIVRSQKPPESADGGGGGSSRGRSSWVSRYGLERDDLKLIEATFPMVDAIVPLKEVGGQILRDDKRRTSQAFGTTPDLLRLANLRVDRGRYLTQADIEQSSPVAVIGAELAKALFPFDDPLDETVRIDSRPMRIIGILAPVGLSGGAGAALVGRDLNFDLHIPISTAVEYFGDFVFRQTSGSRNASSVQISEIYMAASTSAEVIDLAKLVERTLEVRHPAMTDVSMIVPYELLEERRRALRAYNWTLGSIAAISLLVGGIGIMNIMLASVTERTREIGIRRALGATRRHITLQFLVETGVLSSVGGLVGVGLGIGGSILIGLVAESLPTAITVWSIGLAFAVSAATGLVFGIYPAMLAAKQDPIVALRHD
ncbi:MAG: ABC transporter permease [Phycisphaerales bacterium]